MVMKRHLIVMAVAVSAVALGWPVTARQVSRPPSSATRQQAVPFSAGETLTFDVGWANLLTAGTAVVTVQETRGSYGSVAHYITAEGRPTGFIAALYPVQYKADTLLDAFSLLPQRFSIYSDEKGRRRYRIALFDQKKRQVQYEPQADDPTKALTAKTVSMPADTQDALSTIFVLRTKTLSANARFEMPVFLNGRVYAVDMKVTGRERVTCGLGELDAWRIVPTLSTADRTEGREMALWISADHRRLPLKLQGELAVGTFALTLTRAAGLVAR